MKKLILLLGCSFLSSLLIAQTVGINNPVPDTSAILDIKSGSKGLLIPRTSTASRLKINKPAKGLLIYDTTTNSFWYNDSTLWKEIRTDSSGMMTGGLIKVTKQTADGLISTASLLAGAFYEISGVDTALYNDGTNSGTTVILQALTSNTFSQAGKGKFYNPRYNQATPGFGVWSNRSTWTASVTGGIFKANENVIANNGATGKLFTSIEANIFIALTGSWASATSITGATSGATATINGVSLKTYAMGSKVIWGGYSWSNVAGNVGVATNIVTLNSQWSKNVYDTINYNIAIDEIDYDYPNDWIARRYEPGNDNEVIWTKADDTNPYYSRGRSAISVFMFGNKYIGSTYSGCGDNHVYNCYVETVDFSGSLFMSNIFTGYSVMFNNTYAEGMRFAHNNIGSVCYIYNNTSSKYGLFTGNTLKTDAQFIGNSMSDSFHIGGCFLMSGGAINNNTFFQNKNLSILYSTLGTGAAINSNIIGNGCFISNSTAFNSSQISNNILSRGSYISNVHANNESQMSFNNLSDSSFIYHNTADNAGTINQNVLTHSSSINYNKVDEVSLIRANSISYSSLISYNNLSNASQILSLTLMNKNLRKIIGEGGIITGTVTSATLIFGDYSKTLYKRPDGTAKLRYLNDADIMVISNVTD